MRLPRQVSPGSVGFFFLHRSAICIFLRGLSVRRAQPLGTSGLSTAAPPFPSDAPREREKPLDIVVELCCRSCASEGIEDILICCSAAYLRGQTRVFGVNRKGLIVSADCTPPPPLSLHLFVVHDRVGAWRRATHYRGVFFAPLVIKTRFGDVRSAAVQRRQNESLWKRGRRGTPFLHLSPSGHQQLLQRLAEQASTETRTNRQEQTG